MVLGAALATRRSGKPIAAAATAGTLAVLALGYETGQAGGRLVYEHGAAAAYTRPSAGGLSRPGAEPTHHDDGDD